MIRRTKTCGKFMIAVFLLWQVVAVLHLAIATHALCPEHGAVAHADCESGELEHHGDVPFSAEDSCFVLVALAANGGMPSFDAPIAYPQQSYLLDTPEARVVGFLLYQRYRFRLSPSHSPPTASV